MPNNMKPYRRRKITIIILISLIAGMISACGKPESDPASVQAESFSQITGPQLQKDQGRRIECMFAIPDKNEDSSDIQIAASVSVPESEIVQGDYEQTMISADQIETILLDGQKMDFVKKQYSEEVWQIASDPGSDKAFKINYTIDSGIKKSSYDNTSVPNIADIEYTKDQCPTLEMKDQLDILSEKATDVPSQLGITSKLLKATIGEEHGYYMANIISVPCLEDVPLVEPEFGFVKDYYFISNDGVSSMQIHGSYSKKNEKKVSVMSVDDMLKIVEEKAENGEIPGWNDVTYTDITLAYYLDSGTNRFYPVWYLSSNACDVYICINAQTGALMS